MEKEVHPSSNGWGSILAKVHQGATREHTGCDCGSQEVCLVLRGSAVGQESQDPLLAFH